MHRTIILTFVGCYLPGYKMGGPIRTISNMVERLDDELDFRIITADRDFMETKPYPNVVIDGWNSVGNAKVFYASPGNRSLISFVRLINQTPHDVLYLNSFFNPVFTIRPLLARYLSLIPKRPTVIAPRGEFSESALALKWWKKRPYLKFIRVHKLYRDIVWHASSEYEADNIRKSIGAIAENVVVAIVTAADLPVIPKSITEEEQQIAKGLGKPFRVCFLSRISPMKNLDYALRVLIAVNVPVEFSIYGVMEDDLYWRRCQELIKRLPAHVVVCYYGAIDHANVVQTLAKYDLFFFPTRGENYGHVILEAITAGLPVLISDQTPWRNLEAMGVGWDLSLNAEEKFCAVIETQSKLDGGERVTQRQRIREYAKRISEDKKVIFDNIALFRDLAVNRQRSKRDL